MGKKIAYIGKIQLSDTDFSYLHEAQRFADMTCFMEVSPRFLNGPAISLKRIYGKTGIFKAVSVYPEFEKYRDFMNLEKFYVVNTTGRLWQLKSIFTNIYLLFILLRKHYDVIHVTWPLNLYEMSLYALCKKMILTVHDPFPHTAHDTFVVRLRRKMAFRFIRKKIIFNQGQRQKFIDFYGFRSSDVINSRLSNCPFLNVLQEDRQSIPHGEYIIAFGRSASIKGTIIFGDRLAIFIEEWANQIAHELGHMVPRVPYFIVRCAAVFGDILKMAGIHFPMTSFRLKNMSTDNIINLDNIYEIAPNPPVNRVEGIKRTLCWMQEH